MYNSGDANNNGGCIAGSGDRRIHEPGLPERDDRLSVRDGERGVVVCVGDRPDNSFDIQPDAGALCGNGDGRERM